MQSTCIVLVAKRTRGLTLLIKSRILIDAKPKIEADLNKIKRIRKIESPQPF